MFQFGGFAPLAGYLAFNQVGCPIRTPTDQCSCAAPRGFSQLITSFVASESLGIPHTPFFCLSHPALRRDALVILDILFYFVFLL